MTTTELALHWNPIDWPLTHGPIPYAVLAAGWISVAALALSRDRRWLSLRPVGAVLLGGALTGLVEAVVDGWWHPFPEGLPDYVIGWIALALFGISLALFRAPLLSRRHRLYAAGGAALVVLAAASQVNRGFDQYPTARTMLAPKTQALTSGHASDTVTTPPDRALADVWQAPPGLPAKGTVSSTRIPGTKSGFQTRDAYVYLPPAYQASPRPLLPVLVLLPGQPGAPSDWITSGAIQDTLDAFAAEHHGLAPIVVVADPTGDSWTNTLCLDSRIAKAHTYLAEDVPDWIHSRLQTATGRTSTAVGGLSLGGTCSLQLAVNAPQVYGTFLDISGQSEPTLGSHSETVAKAFGGDEAAFAAVDPLHLMAARSFPDTAGVFVVGANDPDFRPQQEKAFDAAKQAGMAVDYQTLPGGHSWSVFRGAFEQNLPWLAKRMGLVR
ncbi:alpha/beta hydrolase family protein [Kitasatospora sp. A2-31]|uniref:alpha/beta hydrolase n=1 Tax=Kitasatospora sp. A2-31 TaxID=2916414 RepID=UPI001EEA72E0|nr:alpha/beta hydrolase-fold protein [Kitasatospora sp. A2-31]MCG6496339.1 esterase family protein [Kitasatospora sp. A2-31]